MPRQATAATELQAKPLFDSVDRRTNRWRNLYQPSWLFVAVLLIALGVQAYQVILAPENYLAFAATCLLSVSFAIFLLDTTAEPRGVTATERLRIEAKKSTEDSLGQREKTIRAFYESAPVTMGIVETHGDDIFCVSDNLDTCENHSGSQPSLAGTWAHESGLSPEEISAWLSAYRQSEAEGRVVQFESEDRESGRWTLASVRFIEDTNDGCKRYSYVAEDITNRKHSEEQLRKKALALTEAKNKAERAETAKGDFLAKMSHEIRTPLNGVIGMTDLLLQTELTNKQARYIDTITNSSELLLGLINDVLDIAKIDSGKLDFEQIPYPVHEIIDGTAELFAARAETNGLRLLTYTDVELPRILVGDPFRIRQILTNLVSNAVKFTHDGEISISATLGDSVSSALSDKTEHNGERTLIFEVSDTGIGIAEQVQQRLFRAFEQASDDVARQYGGSGLGLAISKQLVQLMGGTLSVESQPGRGSTFRFVLPLHAHEDGEADDSGWTRLSRMRVLLVGGRDSERSVYRKYLEHWNVHVTEVTDASEAMPLLTGELEPAYDIALVDTELELRSGVDLVRSIKNSAPDLTTRFILIRGVTEAKAEDEARGLKVLTVTRPVRSPVLLDALSTLTGPSVFKPSDDERVARMEIDQVAPGYHILVADDNPVNLLVMQDMLANVGFAVDTANNGLDAVNMAQRGNYAAILMDCHMPVMDGLEAARAIRTNLSETPDLPIIAITANVTDGYRETCLAAGMTDYLSKPFKMNQLVDMLTRSVIPYAANGTSDMDSNSQNVESEERHNLMDAELRSVFIETTAENLEALDHALLENDSHAVMIAAHTIKGSSAMCELDNIMELAKQIEQYATDGNLCDVGVLADSLKNEVQLFVQDAW